MKYSILVIILSGILVFGCGDEKRKKEDNVGTTKTEVDDSENENEEWLVLFDGQSTNQWRGYLSDSMYDDNWIIENKALKFIPDTTGGKNIITKEKFENFILSLEWKVSEGANSGVLWSVHEDEKFPEAYQTGPEIQVLDNERHPDAKVAGGTHKAGSLYDLIACDSTLIAPAGQWNKMILKINHIENLGKLTMNGTEAFTFPVHGDEWDAMVEKSKFKGWEGFGKYHNGHIALQDHGNIVWFKDIKIKRLK